MDQDRAESTSESADVRHVLKAFYDGYRNVHRNDRLEMGPVVRTFISCSSGFMMGVALGSSQGSLMAGLRFRAENSHRFPTSQRGWFFYHKSKNYHMALGAIKEGLKTGLKYSFWVGLFMSTENAVDKLRAAFARPRTGLSASQDLGSSVVAGLGTAGAFSLLNRFPVSTAARTARIGLLAGFGYGAAQDLVGLVQGRRIGYVEFVRNFLGPEGGASKQDI